MKDLAWTFMGYLIEGISISFFKHVVRRLTEEPVDLLK